jgi:DNA polymerase-3 subunit epsilon
MKTKRLFLDVETTGIDFVKSGIHQISGIIEIDGIVKEKFDFNVKPFEGAEISEEALNVGGVTLEQIMSYPDESVVYKALSDIFAKYVYKFDKKDKFVMVGYNVYFDKNMLANLWLRNDDKYLFSNIRGNCIDVMSMATEFLESELSSMENFKLFTVAKKLGLDINEEKLHNSLYDIETTRNMFLKIKGIEVIETQTTTPNLNDFLPKEPLPLSTINSEAANINLICDKNWKFPFGKHRTKSIAEVIDNAPDYVVWFIENVDKFEFCDTILSEAKEAVDKREPIFNKPSYYSNKHFNDNTRNKTENYDFDNDLPF